MNESHSLDRQVPSLRIRAEWTSHCMFSLLFAPICLFALVVTFKKPDQWHDLLFTLIAAAFPQLWLYFFEIVLHEDRLSYRTLFAGRREIFFANITRAKIEVGTGQGLKARTQPFYRLVLYDGGRFARDPLIINMKPFSGSDLARVAQAIVRNAPSAKIDKSVTSLSQGSIKPLAREAAQQIWKAVMLIFIVFLVLGLIRAFLMASH